MTKRVENYSINDLSKVMRDAAELRTPLKVGKQALKKPTFTTAAL